ncbi:MAG TPA: DUF423 domain-containing protein [Balneolaceae bacterium]|nr:DUF423 domain-containing protein [Balneolaceae bacterium]
MFKTFVTLGSINAFLAVALGAFGAHGLKGKLSAEMLSVFETGVQYHFYHALGLLAIGIIATQLPNSTWLKTSGWVMFAGIVIFSGSLYLLSITSIRWLGAITPFGGVCFLISWVLLVVAVLK